MYSAKNIATYTINWCHKHGAEITNLKLQKLLYFIQGECVYYKKSRLIAEDFYAWQLGPVIPEVYTEYSFYSSSLLPDEPPFSSLCQEDISIIGSILQKYAHRPTWTLVELSHQQDPWKYNHEIFGERAIIPYKSIYDYFVNGENL